MREGSVHKIGEFARVAQVSVATLRYYEKVGLFLPVVPPARFGSDMMSR